MTSQTEQAIRDLLPPGNGDRTEAIIDGVHVKRYAVHYLIAGSLKAYSVGDAEYLIEAYRRGVEAAKAAATWIGNGDPGLDEPHVRRLLGMLDDGDPQVFDYLPMAPNLSGEWGGDPTPLSLAREITGMGPRYVVAGATDLEEEDPSIELIDALSDAFEQGVSETFEQECEAELRRWVDA